MCCGCVRTGINIHPCEAAYQMHDTLRKMHERFEVAREYASRFPGNVQAQKDAIVTYEQWKKAEWAYHHHFVPPATISTQRL